MNQSIHKELGEPTSMPSPFSSELESAAESAVDHYWDDWEEYDTDREGLVEHAKKAYLRAYFKETFNKMVQMFSESENAGVNENRFLAASMEDLEQVIRNLAHTGEMSEDEAIELAIKKLEAMLDGRDDMDEGVAKTQKAHGLVVAKMKELAKQYKAGDTSVVAQLKDLTAKKKQLEKQLEKDVAGKNRNQQLDTAGSIDEDKADAARWFGNLKYYYQKAFAELKGEDRETYKQLTKDFFSKLKIDQHVRPVGLSEGEGQDLSELKPGDKFEFNGKTFTLIKHIEGSIAKVILPNGDTSTVSFGGKVNTGKKAGIGPDAFGQGKGHHIDEEKGLNEGE